MINKFLAQDVELEAFITGPAGSGKTTYLADVIKQLDKDQINYRVVAYTHKAKDVLINKLPQDTPISTLHSWLKKRPGINAKAKQMQHLMISTQRGSPQHLELLIVDEFSMVSEKDYWSIGELQDEVLLEESVTTYKCIDCGSDDVDDSGILCLECGEGNIEDIVGKIPKPLKVLYVGDLNQLQSIEGDSIIIPHKPYWTVLTTIHRTSSMLVEPLAYLVKMIEGDVPMSYLQPNKDFIRGVNIDESYKADKSNSKKLVAYTNKAVQEHNAVIQGYILPKIDDTVYLSSLKRSIRIVRVMVYKDLPGNVILTTPNGIINNDTKYNPIKQLAKHKEVIYYLADNDSIYPAIFGSYNNKIVRETLGRELTKANKNNSSAIVRNNAYKAYKVINDFVSNCDFTHASSIHKMQGQEVENIYVDSKDIAICKSAEDRMRLLYVAISRAHNKAVLND